MDRQGDGTAGCGAGFDDMLLALHDPGRGLADAPGSALAGLGAFVPHAAAWLGHGAMGQDGLPRLLSQTRRNLPADFPDQWYRIRQFDPLAPQVGCPGDHAVLSDVPDLPAPLRRFLALNGIGRALCVTAPGLLSQGFLFLSLYRPATAPDFAPEQIDRARLFIRHLSQALRNRLASGPVAARVQSAAVTLEGQLDHASAALRERLGAAGVALEAGCLPPALIRQLLRQGVVELDSLRLRLTEAPGLMVLTLSDPSPALSAREAQVARAYAAGLGFRAIAAELGISPHTARNHIGAIYRKLGVGSKLELAARLEPDGDQ